MLISTTDSIINSSSNLCDCVCGVPHNRCFRTSGAVVVSHVSNSRASRFVWGEVVFTRVFVIILVVVLFRFIFAMWSRLHLIGCGCLVNDSDMSR
jgi:hypothetical protein